MKSLSFFSVLFACSLVTRAFPQSTSVPAAFSNLFPNGTDEETFAIPLPAVMPQVAPAYGLRPLSFVRNDGQADPTTKFQVQGRGYLLSLEETGAVMLLPELARPRGNSSGQGQINEATATSVSAVSDEVIPPLRAVRMKLLGALTSAIISGEEELPGKFNFFIGRDPTAWRTNVPSFAKVRYGETYPGIDLVYYGSEGQLEFDFVVKPGADPGQIALAIEGADSVEIAPGGDLRLAVAGRELLWRKPVLYQNLDGLRVPVEGEYVVHGGASGQTLGAIRNVSFRVAPFNRASALVIDPVLAYSTYLGGAWSERPEDIVVDASGCLYVVGGTGTGSGTLFPTTTNSISRKGGGAFVTKFAPEGNKLIYSTLFCGAVKGDHGAWATGIAIDAVGQAVIVGGTDAPDFPTKNPIQPAFGGFYDAFVAKLNTNGSALIFSTFLGGSDLETGNYGWPINKVKLDADNNIYVLGGTQSLDFPVANALQKIPGGEMDLFVAKLDPDGTKLLYSTYWGDTAEEEPVGLDVDPAGNAYLLASVKPLAEDTYHYRFVKLAASGASIERSFSLPALTNCYVSAMSLDRNGALYVVGATWGDGLPTTSKAFQASPAGGGDAFVGKLKPDGSTWEYLTYLGGSFRDGAGGIFVDQAGHAFVVGSTSSTNFPVRNAFQDRNRGSCLEGCDLGTGGNAFVCELSPDGTDLVWSTYLGGSNANPFWPIADGATEIVVDKQGGVYVAGSTISPNFPVVNPFQKSRNFSNSSALPVDAFVSKFVEPLPALRISRIETAVNISWPLSSADFVLESATSLGPGASWIPEPKSPSVTPDEILVSIEIGDGSKFFRLRKQ